MEVKIGVQYAARELIVDVDGSSDEVERAVEAAFNDGSKTLGLTDSKGRKVLIAADKITYVEIGSSSAGKVGFKA